MIPKLILLAFETSCLEGQVPRDMFVRLGEYDFGRESSSTAVDHEVDYFVIHTYYDKFTHVNDIAILVKLASFEWTLIVVQLIKSN